MGLLSRWTLGLTQASVALSVFLTIGCEPRVSLGLACDVSSDCDAPYVCTAGRCRVECREARDCPFPLECMLVGNVGGCRVGEADACPRGTLDCAPGLECIGGRCAQPCTDHDQCAAAQTCAVDGECDRPPLVPGSCDVLSGAGCEEGQRCSFEGTCESVGVMTSPAQDELFGACDAERPCRSGFECRVGRCVRLCQLDASGRTLTSCTKGSRCQPRDERGGAAPAGFGFCTQPCDPADAAGTCPEGMGCGADFLAMDFQVSCEVGFVGDCEADPTQDGCPFQRCDPTNRCAIGTDCLDTLSMGDVPSLCLPFCDDTDTCPSGSVCAHGDFSVRYTIGDTALERGICLPTCVIGEGICSPPDELDLGCDESHPIDGTTALCTQRCFDDTDCFALYRCDTSSGLCTARNPF